MSKLNVRKHLKEILGFLKAGDFEETESGLLIHSCLQGRGKYVHTVNGEDEREDYNLIPAEGIAHILNVVFGATSKVTTWYLAPYTNNYTPVSGITSADFYTTAGELQGAPEGYTQSTRVAWNEGVATAGKIGNLGGGGGGTRAVFTIVTGSTLAINGAGLLSTSAKYTAGGTLVSATKFASTRTLNNTDTFELGYEVELTDS